MKGKIKKLNENGFGEIEIANGKILEFHASAIIDYDIKYDTTSMPDNLMKQYKPGTLVDVEIFPVLFQKVIIKVRTSNDIQVFKKKV